MILLYHKITPSLIRVFPRVACRKPIRSNTKKPPELSSRGLTGRPNNDGEMKNCTLILKKIYIAYNLSNQSDI